MTFQPNKRFRRKYNRLFKKDAIEANMFLLLAELADEKGQVKFKATNELGIAEEISKLMAARFQDPEEYQL